MGHPRSRLAREPHLDRIVFNTVIEPVSTTSGTTVPIEQQMSLYRVAQLHFADEDALVCYRHLFQDHPIPTEPSPQGRSDFRFYVICESVQVTREGSE